MVTIPAEMQADILQKATAFLAGHHPVTIDGESVEPALMRANFLERTLRTSRVIDPPVDLDINSAIMGVIFVYPHEAFADTVTMEWDMFDDRIQIVPVAGVDPTGPLPQFLEPDFSTLEVAKLYPYSRDAGARQYQRAPRIDFGIGWFTCVGYSVS